MAWVWQDDEPDRRLSLYDDPNQRPRVGSYAETLPDWILQGPQAGGPRPLMAQPEAPQSQGVNYNRVATVLGSAAQAISPESFGGRLGRSAAQLGIHYGDQAYRERLEQERWRQRMLRGLMDRRGRAVAPGYTIPPEGRDPNQPYTAPLTLSQRTRAIYPGQEIVGETPGGRVGPLYQSERTPTQVAPPATALGSSRPAYGPYPAVTGQFSPRESTVVVSPGQEVTGLTPEGEYGSLYESARTPTQLAPPATAPGYYRPAYGEQPAVTGPLLPSQQAKPVLVSPGQSVLPADVQPGVQPLYQAPYSPRQATVPLTPGATAYQPGATRGPYTAPYSPAQQRTATEKRGLLQVPPDRVVIDAKGNVIYQRGPSTKPEKPGKPTGFDKQVDTWAQKFSRLQDIAEVPSRWFDGRSARPGQTAAQQAEQMILEETTAGRRNAMERAFEQVFYGEAGQAAQPVTPKRFRFDAQGNLLQ